ncbi:MAG TPA: transcriptional repressor [Hydrogenispora sp.]|jgi:Fur family ferric uptake transcriptional regulator|nr:transcriptional repressor [Hydrogenispora sp.]
MRVGIKLEKSLREQITEISEALRRKGYRLTPQREAVIKILLENPNQHLAAEDIYAMVRKTHPEIGMATVYRTLDLLSKEKIINQLSFEEGHCRYEMESQAHHHHLVCLKCGKITEFNIQLLKKMEEALAAEHEFQIVGYLLKFYGYCAQCTPAEE